MSWCSRAERTSSPPRPAAPCAGNRLTGAIVKLAHTLGLQTIAEGIEEPEQLQHLRELDCEMGQGFLFARPAEPDGIAQLLGSSLLLTI